jgi:hypothetical protein
VYFTRHAKNGLREEKLTEEDAEFIVCNPVRVERETTGNWRYLGQVGGRWYRVVVAGDDLNVVITVHPRRNP